ncbi:MAG: NAD+ synthase [Pseudomonadota bacterium]
MTNRQLKIALAQLNPTVGDIAGNLAKAREAHAEARVQGADLIVFSELFITGYPPEDLVLKPAFAEASRRAVEDLARDTVGGPGILIGAIWPDANGTETALYNSVAMLDQGEITGVRHKVALPNYSVFDEKRVFDAGPLPGPVNFRGVRIGVPICEDIWFDEVPECLAESGAEMLLVANGSPYDRDKRETRVNIVVARVTETGLPLAYVNQVGGQDELVFDGGSLVINPGGALAVQMAGWAETIQMTTWTETDDGWMCEPGPRALIEESDAADYLACMYGLRDYVSKNGFPGVVLGLSGGIDSALCAALAVDALGADKDNIIMLPYRYTSAESVTDARLCAETLGVRYDTVPIGGAVDAMGDALAPLFAGLEPGVTEENIQSRMRGSTLMAVSNKFGGMVVTTGNKSEMSVGYATLYGDMNGGYNPIKDLYKTEVYRLSAWRNVNRPEGALGPSGVVIPENIITKAPTAELRENQTDQDSLPEYDVLDDILKCLVDREMPIPDIIARGHAPETVQRIERLLYIAEYKRRQAAPGVKISSRNFGRDRRYPIVNKFREL